MRHLYSASFKQINNLLYTSIKSTSVQTLTKSNFRSIKPVQNLVFIRCYGEVKKYPKRKRKQPIPIIERTTEEAVTNILYDMPDTSSTPSRRHVINCLVGNEPGVLSRVSGILAARNFNIDSIICAKTDIKDLSRMTIVLIESPVVVKQAVRQLQDLVPVWAVLDYTNTKYLERELLMAKVSLHGPIPESNEIETENEKFSHGNSQNNLLALTQLTNLFQGRIVDVTLDCVIIELSAKCQRVEAFLNLLKPYGILEAARSGPMAMQRSSLDQYIDEEEEPESSPDIDVSSLPPG